MSRNVVDESVLNVGRKGARDLQICAVFPTNGIGTDPGAIREFAQTAEGLGYSQILIYDHLLVPANALGNLYESADLEVHTNTQVAHRGQRTGGVNEFHEALTLLAYLAGLTSRIKLATGILVIPMRQTALVAKQVAEVQILSAGRLILGVGVGWNPVEFGAMGVPLQGRGDRLEEQLDVLGMLLALPVAKFEGRFHHIEPCGMNPKPKLPVPIWMGGTSVRAYARAARLADGYIFHGPGSRKDVENAVPMVIDHLLERKRDPDAFALECMIDFSIGPEGWTDEIESWRKLGGTHVAMRSMDMTADYFGVPKNNFTSPQQYIHALEIFAREIGLGSAIGAAN